MVLEFQSKKEKKKRERERVGQNGFLWNKFSILKNGIKWKLTSRIKFKGDYSCTGVDKII